MDYKKIVLIGALTAGVTACGGGSDSSSYGVNYQGSTEAGSINETSKASYQDAGVEVVVSYTGTDALGALPGAIETTNVASSDDIEAAKKAQSLLGDIFKSKQAVPTGASETDYGSCGGKVTYSGSNSSATATFSNYCDVETEYLTFNGKIDFSFSETSSTEKYVMTYRNFEMSDGEETITFNGRMVTSYNYNTDEERFAIDATISYDGETVVVSMESICTMGDCSFNVAMQGSNGLIYKLNDVEEMDGELSGTLFEPEYGYVSMEATNLTYCLDQDDSVQLSTGTIMLEDESGAVLEITVDGCGVYSSEIQQPLMLK